MGNCVLGYDAHKKRATMRSIVNGRPEGASTLWWVKGNALAGFGTESQGHQLTLTSHHQTPAWQAKHRATRQVGVLPPPRGDSRALVHRSKRKA